MHVRDAWSMVLGRQGRDKSGWIIKMKRVDVAIIFYFHRKQIPRVDDLHFCCRH